MSEQGEKRTWYHLSMVLMFGAVVIICLQFQPRLSVRNTGMPVILQTTYYGWPVDGRLHRQVIYVHNGLIEDDSSEWIPEGVITNLGLLLGITLCIALLARWRTVGQFRFWQIHLSTAIILMFAVGCLMWANLSEYPAPFNDSAKKSHHGWPFPADSKYVATESGGLSWHWWHFQQIIANSIVGFFIILMVTIASEWLIRRREVRKS